ncbi:MAG: von Willebrand factor type A domain-containing protein [Myxococcales bacterium]|nr:von Willebrand factor type A domain-containing protein [Myxococcales bacterium]
MTLAAAGCDRRAPSPTEHVDEQPVAAAPAPVETPETGTPVAEPRASETAPAPAPRILQNPVIDASLLYAAKIERPKRPRRRRSTATKSSKPMKKLDMAGDGMIGLGSAGLIGKGGGGGGGGMAKSKAAPSAGPSGGSSSSGPPVHRSAPPQERAAGKDEVKPDEGGKNTRYLSADDSNSQASPVLVRQAIKSGRYVDPSLVRTYEFLNYYSFDYEPPAQPDDLAITAAMRATDVQDEYSLQVAVRAPDRARAAMKPLHTTILLDTSGSMAGPSIELARTFLERFAGGLRPGDSLSLVVANRDATLLIEHLEVSAPGTAARELAAALGRAEAQPNDVTDLERGMKLAYDVATRHLSERVSSRVMLVSDGAANFGRLSTRVIEQHAADADKEGVYLIGVGLGVGFNDQLMNAFTDRGRGAYVFLDAPEEIDRVLAGARFVSNFDVSLKDVRLKMVMPDGWSVKSFHGEQISRSKAKVTPQYLAPNDQMIYHMIVKATPDDGAEAKAKAKEKEKTKAPSPAGEDAPEDRAQAAGAAATRAAARFEFEAEFTPIGAAGRTRAAELAVAEMLGEDKRAIKGNALVVFAETIKKMKYPLAQHREANLALLDRALVFVSDAQQYLVDNELGDLVALMKRYRETLALGERFPGARDQEDTSPDAVLGIPAEYVKSVKLRGPKTSKAIRGLRRLRDARKLMPQEGYQFLAISSGPVGSEWPAGSGELSPRTFSDPRPRFMGARRATKPREPVHDLHQVTIELVAPPQAQSFSFDFNYFSAEYPEFIQQDYNDSFYAILQAGSTHDGAPTNISFDANNRSIEVDNNYFQNQFQPIPNWGTGFDDHGSTGWLRTSWPIKAGETFTITFSVHDEGDAIYDSLVLLDNFAFHHYPAVGTTDPLN